MSERREQNAGEGWSPSAAREKLRKKLSIARRPSVEHQRQARILLDAIDETGPHPRAVDSPEVFTAFMSSLHPVDPELKAYRTGLRRRRSGS